MGGKLILGTMQQICLMKGNNFGLNSTQIKVISYETKLLEVRERENLRLQNTDRIKLTEMV